MPNINVTSEQTRFRKDISDQIELRLINSPMNHFGFGEPRRGDSDMRFVYGEQVRSEAFGVLAANYIVASGTLTVADSTLFSANDQIHMKNHLDLNGTDLVFEVTVIVNATTLSIVLLNGIDTAATVINNSQIQIMRGFGDNAAAGTGKYQEATDNFGFIQMFQEDFELGQKLIDRTAASGTYGVANLVAATAAQKIDELRWSIWRQFLYGFGRAETPTKPAMSRSLTETINQPANLNRINAEGGTLTETLLNNMVESMLKNGGHEGPKMLLSNLRNVRTLSQLRHDKVSFTTEDKINTLGGRVNVFNTEFDGIGQVILVGDPNFDATRAFMIDLSSVEITPGSGATGNSGLTGTLENTTAPGTHGQRWTIRTELGLRVSHQFRDHGVFRNLAPG